MSNNKKLQNCSNFANKMSDNNLRENIVNILSKYSPKNTIKSISNTTNISCSAIESWFYKGTKIQGHNLVILYEKYQCIRCYLGIRLTTRKKLIKFHEESVEEKTRKVLRLLKKTLNFLQSY